MTRRPLLALALLLLAAPAGAADRFGPLPVRSQSPIHLLYLGQRPLRATTPPMGFLDLSIDAAVSNLLQRTPATGGWVLDLDMELWRFTLAARFAPLDGLDIGVEWAMLRFDGGLLDATIDAWHRALRTTEGRRPSLPSDRFAYRLAPEHEVRLDLAPLPLGLSDTTIDARVRLMSGGVSARTRPALAMQVALKLPSGAWREGLGSGAPDLGAWMLLEQGGKVLALHGSLGLVLQGPAAALSDLQIPLVLTWMAAAELRLAAPLSLLVQIEGATPRLWALRASNETGVSLDLAIGLRGGACGWSWQLAFVEELVTNGPSVDFTAMAGIGRTLPAPRRPEGAGRRTGRPCQPAQAGGVPLHR